MADPIIDPNAIPAPGSAAPVVANGAAANPAAVAPIAADGSSPAAPETAAPAAPAITTPAEAAVSSSAPAPAEAPKPELTTDKPSLLEQIASPGEKPAEPAKPAEAKPEGEKPAAEAKPGEAKPAETPAAEAKPAEAAQPAEPLAPIEYKFEWPEAVTPVADKVTAFTDILNEGRVSPEIAQKFVNLHAEALQTATTQMFADQHRVFNEMRKSWNTEIMADEVLGGAGHQTAMQAVARARDALVPSEMLEPRKYDDGSPRLSQFEEFLRVTGAGDHPVFARILHNADRFISEAPFTPIEIAPPPNNGRAPGDRFARLYPNTPRQRS